MASGLESFLKLDGIEGESADRQHAREIDVLAGAPVKGGWDVRKNARI